MIRRLFRQVGAMAVGRFLWHHRGSVVRAIDLARRVPDLLRSSRGGDIVTEAKAILALDGRVPDRYDVRISGIHDGTITLRGDVQAGTLEAARSALLRITAVQDVQTDGTTQPTIDTLIPTA